MRRAVRSVLLARLDDPTVSRLRPARRAASQRRAGASRRDRRGREGSGAALPGSRPPRRRRPCAPRLGDAGPRRAACQRPWRTCSSRRSRSSNDEAKYNLELALQRARGSSSPRVRAARTRRREEAVPRARAPAIPEAATRPRRRVPDHPHAAGSASRPRHRRAAVRAPADSSPRAAARDDARRRRAGAAHASLLPLACARCGRNAPRARSDSARLRVDTTTAPCGRTPRRSSCSTSPARCSRRINLDSPQRIERAKVGGDRDPARASGRRVGVASLTDRVLPHLFPSADEKVFEATIDRSLAIERPPPRSSFLTGATSLNALATMRGLRFFTPTSTVARRDRAHGRRERWRRERPTRRPLQARPRDRARLRAVLGRGREGVLARRARAAVPVRTRPRVRDPRPARGVDDGRGLLRGSGRRRDAQDAASSSAAARPSSRASGRTSSRSRRTSPSCGPLPVRAPPVAPRSLG